MEYVPKPLSISTDTRVLSIALHVLNRSLAIVVGAGLSEAPPTSLPLAQKLAQTLKSSLQLTALAGRVAQANGDDLLDVADKAIVTGDDLSIIQRKITDLFPQLKTAPPNYGHKALALLMAEGVLVLSTNWDTCIERAGHTVYVEIAACRTHEELQGAGASVRLPKLHGCAQKDSSLFVSSRQIEKSPWWCGHQIGAALENGFVTFLGIGSLAPYIKNTVLEILRKTNGKSACVVAPTLSGDWGEILPNDESRFLMAAEQFLDDMLRAITMDSLSKVLALADKKKSEPPVAEIDIESTTHNTVDFLSKYPAHIVWLWARRGLVPQGYGAIAIDPLFQKCIMALALINTVSRLREVTARGSVVSIRSEHFIIELALAKQLTLSDELSNGKRDSLLSDKRADLFPHSDNFLVLSYNHFGPLPSVVMPQDLVDNREGIIYAAFMVNGLHLPLLCLLLVTTGIITRFNSPKGRKYLIIAFPLLCIWGIVFSGLALRMINPMPLHKALTGSSLIWLAFAAFFAVAILIAAMIRRFTNLSGQAK